jgi:hypothetical protein
MRIDLKKELKNHNLRLNTDPDVSPRQNSERLVKST